MKWFWIWSQNWINVKIIQLKEQIVLSTSDPNFRQQKSHQFSGHSIEESESTTRMPNIKVFSGSSHPDLAKKTVERLGISKTLRVFPNFVLNFDLFSQNRYWFGKSRSQEVFKSGDLVFIFTAFFYWYSEEFLREFWPFFQLFTQNSDLFFE